MQGIATVFFVKKINVSFLTRNSMNVGVLAANLVLWLVATTGYKSLQNFSEYKQNVLVDFGGKKK